MQSKHFDLKKYEASLFKLNTGETVLIRFNAFNDSSAKELIEDLYDSSEYQVTYLHELISVVKIQVTPYCPN